MHVLMDLPITLFSGLWIHFYPIMLVNPCQAEAPRFLGLFSFRLITRFV